MTSIWTVALCCLLLSDLGLANNINYKFQWRGVTLFLDPATGVAKATEGLPFKMPEVEPTPENSLPLIPDDTPVFPGSRQFLFLNEMKFRELICDSVNLFDGKMVRCLVDDRTGLIHPEGVACRILEKKSLKSGEIMCVIEAYTRMRVESTHRKETSSYLTAIVSPSPEPTVPDEALSELVRCNEEASIKLYSVLKAYLRLVALRIKNTYKETDAEYGQEKYLCLSPQIHQHRPPNPADRFGGAVAETLQEKHIRQREFSYAVGNLIKSSSYMMQRLVEGDTGGRLGGLLQVINAANNVMRSGVKGITSEDVDEQLLLSADPADLAIDLLPPSDYKELSLDMIQMMDDFEVDEDEADTGEGSLNRIELAEDDWGTGAFQ